MNKNLITKLIMLVVTIGISGCLLGIGSSKNADYVDGTYRAEGKTADKNGWRIFMEVEVKDGEVSGVTVDYINDITGILKTEDADYNLNMLRISDSNPILFTREFAVDIITKQGVDDLDTVSGATHTSQEVKILGEKIFENAKKGNTELIVVDLSEH